MGHYSAFVFFAFASCLVACVSVIAVDGVSETQSPAITKDIASGAVVAAKNAIKEVSGKAQINIDSAAVLLGKVKLFKQQADEATTEAQEAKENEKAKAIIEDITSISGTVSSSYQTAIAQLESANSSMVKLLSEAKTMEDDCNKIILTNDKTPADYTAENNEAVGIKTKAVGLETNINAASTIISGVTSTADNMESSVKEVQVKNFHVGVIVAVAKIETMIGEADGKKTETQNHKGAVNDIVNEMMKHCKKELIDSNEILKKECQSSDDALTSVTGAVTKALKADADIKQQKGLADTALANMKKPNINLSQAEAEANAARTSVGTAEQHVVQLNNALQTAKESVTKANNAKQGIKKALSTTTSATRTEQSVTNLQVKQLQDSVRTAVNTIKTTVEEAEITLQKTENHKKTVHDIVQEIKTLSTTEFIESNKIIKMLYKKADDALADATVAVKSAEKANTDMTQEKQKADDTLSRVETAKDVETAQEEVNSANECVNQVTQFAAILKSALQTATNLVTSATDLKKKLEKALSTTTTAPSSVENTEKEKANPPVGQGTEPDPKDTTIQPTSKELPSQSNNSAEEIKNTLVKGAQNVPPTALTGEKAPAPGAKNDSAMPVSVPLLVALIASAVLQ